MSDNPKKLALKAELLRHLETAEGMFQDNQPSSFYRVIALNIDITRVDKGFEPNLVLWGKIMNNQI